MTGPLVSCQYEAEGRTTKHLQVGATNTDIHDGPDLLVAIALPVTTAHLLGELLHMLEHRVDILDDTVAIDLHGLVGGVAERNVVDGTVLGEVDVLTREHVIPQLFDIGLLGQFDQQRQGLLGQEVLGEVKEDLRVVHRVGKAAGELLEALGVFLEVLLQDNVAPESIVVLLELLPRIELGGL